MVCWLVGRFVGWLAVLLRPAYWSVIVYKSQTIYLSTALTLLCCHHCVLPTTIRHFPRLAGHHKSETIQKEMVHINSQLFFFFFFFFFLHVAEGNRKFLEQTHHDVAVELIPVGAHHCTVIEQITFETHNNHVIILISFKELVLKSISHKCISFENYKCHATRLIQAETLHNPLESYQRHVTELNPHTTHSQAAQPNPLKSHYSHVTEPTLLKSKHSHATEPIPLKSHHTHATEPNLLKSHSHATEPIPLKSHHSHATEPNKLKSHHSHATEPIPLKSHYSQATEPIPLKSHHSQATQIIPLVKFHIHTSELNTFC